MVKAKLEQKGDNSRLYQEWANKFTLPEEADISQLKSVLDGKGILRIETPMLPRKDEIPIDILFVKK